MSSINGFTIRNGTRTNGGILNNGNGVAVPPGMLASTAILGEEEAEPASPLRLVEPPVEAKLAESPPQATARSWQVTGGAVEPEQNRDRQAANELVKLVQQLNQAMDEAKRGGLIVEPSLATTQSQFGGDGSSGHMISVKIFRKLC